MASNNIEQENQTEEKVAQYFEILSPETSIYDYKYHRLI